MKIAVTSASRKLGTAIIKMLVISSNTDSIIGIARTPENAKHLGVKIRKGDFNVISNFEEIVGRPHKSILQMITDYKNNIA